MTSCDTRPSSHKREGRVSETMRTEVQFGPEVQPEDVCDVHVHTAPARHVTAADDARTAIIVCHGMGQQVKWQTLEQFIHLLRPPREREADPIDAQIVRLSNG